MKIILMLIISLCLSSCAMMESIEHQKDFLSGVFPNSVITEDEYVAMIYYVYDTINCNTYVVELSPYKRRTIYSVHRIN